MRRRFTGHAQSSSGRTETVPNPLLRRSDVAQARAKRTVTMLMIVMLPLSVWIGSMTHTSSQERYQSQLGTVHAVTATVTAASPSDAMTATEFTATSSPVSSVDAQWMYRGIEHTGSIITAGDSPVGAQMSIWVGEDGRPTTPPLTSADVTFAAAFTAVGSWLLVASLLGGAYFALRFRWDAQREEQWDRDITELLKSHD